MKSFENAPNLPGRDANSLVGYRDHCFAPDALPSHSDSTPAWRIFHRVVDEVADHLRNSPRIGQHRAVQAPVQLDRVLARQRACAIYRLLDDWTEVHWLTVYAKHARVQPR